MDQAFLEFARADQQQTVALDRARFALGRTDDNDLAFPEDCTVSGHHAVIEQQGDNWLIRDLDSANGTKVNGQRIGSARLLRSGDSILLGQTELEFHAARPASIPAAVPPSDEYFDITEEWESAGARSASAQQTGPLPTWPERTAQPPVLGSDPAGDGSLQVGAATGTGTPGPQVSASRWPARRGNARLRGTARNVNVREGSILSFRVERYDASGDRLPPVGVELYGFRSGQVSDGEEVEVSGRWSRGTLHATKIINLATGAQVLGVPESAKAVFALIFGVIIAASIVFIIVFFIFVVKVQP